jgi:hypothetical protein
MDTTCGTGASGASLVTKSLDRQRKLAFIPEPRLSGCLAVQRSAANNLPVIAISLICIETLEKKKSSSNPQR